MSMFQLHGDRRSWRATLCMATLLMTFALRVEAQTRSDTALPEVLGTLKPAAGMCLISDAVAAGPGVKTATVTPDLSCAITTAALVPLLDRPDLLLADMRQPESYGAFRIADSVNMTEGQLRSRRYLRNKTVVLIGTGKAERELYAACAYLKAGGYKQVRVLRGGMAAWLAHEQGVVGRAPGLDPLVRLTPAELWQEARFDGNLVLVAPGRGDILSELPHSVVIQDERPETIGAVLERRRKESGSAPLAAVVLVAGTAFNADRLRILQRAIQPVPLLIYADSTEALVRYVAQQKSVWAARERGPKQAGCGL